ncbi:MAG TPA: 30S ribosomal protein S1 [Syntrophaceae bacterium]|nr:30S ribosomal protein S1 [Syntrophaceae bacterium]
MDNMGSTSSSNIGQLYEESMRKIQEGEVVKGRIVFIDKDFVMVDIGYKSEGQIPIHEFQDRDGNITTRIGAMVDVLIERRDDEGGHVVLSRNKATQIKAWEEIVRVYNQDGTIEGKIISRVKGGLVVDIGIPAFLPGSQVALQPVRDFDSLIGKEFHFKILKYNRKNGNVIVSRRVILEKERAELKAKTLASLEEGQIREGVVKNITDYGVFVDLGGVDGLLHITDMSWGRISHPKEMFSNGDRINVKILKFDPSEGMISLGLKQLVPDPWTQVQDKYPIGSHVQGKVVNLVNYGAFVELEPGVEGLIHVSEMSWTRKIRHPSQILSIGDRVEACVLNVIPESKRISLGLKQMEPNPWESISEKYPVGTIIRGRIKNITDFGIFIGIDEGIDGLVHVSDISWTKRFKHPSELYKKGQEVQAVVLNIDKENEKFSLGIKQLTPDPWKEAPKKYKVGKKITGTITHITDFGIFVELEEGIEGLIHVSEIGKDKGKIPVDRFKSGEEITAKVVNVIKRERKIGLSLRKLEEDEEKRLLKEYSSRSNQRFVAHNLGELLKEGLEREELKDKKA